MNHNLKQLESRVVAAAETALFQRKVVTAIDVLLGIQWLRPELVEAWRRGRVPYLERVVTANLHRISIAMKMFRAWARRRGLKASETVYVSWTRDRRRLRFSKSGVEAIERAYRTHWVSTGLSEEKRARLKERAEPDARSVDVPDNPRLR